MLKKTISASKKALASKYFPVFIAIIAFVMSLYSIDNGLMLDDLAHRAVLIDPEHLPQEIYKTGLEPGVSGKLSSAIIYTFAFVKKEYLGAGKEYGSLPWWSPDEFQAAMWRPLASFTHWLDYRFFPLNPKLMHIHHLIWFSAVIFLAAILYRKLIGPTWIAAFAAIMFLIDENNTFCVIFNAHRNSIIALFFGLLCVLCHFKWRKDNSLIAAITAPFLLLLSLLSAEAGVATFAFILAYAIALGNGSIKKRALTILPAVFVIILWRIVYNYLGYGVQGFGVYIDPVYEPVRFTITLLERLPVMLFGLFSPVSPDFLSSLSPLSKIWFVVICVLSFIFISLILLPLLRRNRIALFLYLSTIFAIIPFCACFASSRNLLFAGVPAFGLIAIFIVDVFKKAGYLLKNILLKAIIWITGISLFLTHLPGAAHGKAASLKLVDTILLGADVPRVISDNINKEQNIVIVNTPCALGLAFIPFYQAYHEKDIPNSARTLVPGFRDIKVTRTDEKTLVIKSENDNFFNCTDIGPMHIAYVFKSFNDLFNDKKQKFELGQIFIYPQLTIEILAIDDNHMPTEISFNFNMPLEDESLRFYWYDWYTLNHREFEVPTIGQAVEIRGPAKVDLRGIYNFFKWQFTK